MQTRRRLQPKDSEQQEEKNHLISQTVFTDTEPSSLVPDDKCVKFGQNWDLGLLSNRVQLTSGKSLRKFIQPLNVAGIVTGNYLKENYSKFGSQLSNSEKDIEFDENIAVMASRDRTTEFTNAIRSLQSRNISQAVNIKDPRKVKHVQSYSEFMMVAKYIGRSIANTYMKLEKLTLLAKKKSLFDDRPTEIQELTYIIKGDLNALNQQIARLQDISRDQRRNKNSKHLISHSSNMVLALQSKLASMSTDFKQILEVRTENLKQQKSRRDQFIQGPHFVTPVSHPALNRGSLLLCEDNQAISIDMSSDDHNPLLDGKQRICTQKQITLSDESDSYIQQRAETMQNIESTVVELGGIFQQLAHMVKEQDEMVERIDTNVQDAELNIEAAHSEILKYFQSVSKNRWLLIKVFGVLILFFIFFVIFVA